MESEVTKPRSGDTSMDSKGSGGSQKSMLELLTITDAAVKALNKSTHSTGSQGSGKSAGNQSIHSTGSHASGRSGQSAGSVQNRSSGTKQTDSPATNQPNNGRVIRPEHTDQLLSDRSDRSAHSRVSEVSVTSHRSGVSARSGQSGASARSGQSGMSARSGQSVQSQSSGRDVKVTQPTSDISRDSGVISKTQTTSEKSKPRGATLVSPTDDTLHERSSDESTTASDVLIRSTLDKSDRSVLAEAQKADNGSSSGSSKCSKTSFGVENFNSSGPQKVKISRKHLREIKPPFEDQSPRSSASSDGKVPSALLNGAGTLINHKTGQEMEVVTSSNDSNGDKFPQRSFPRGAVGSEQFKVEKVRKSADKVYEDINMVPKTKPRTTSNDYVNDNKFEKKSQSSATASSRSGDPRPKGDSKKSQPALADKITDPSLQFRSTPKYFVERHTPQKSQPQTNNNGLGGDLPERKNLLQDLEDSVEIITARGRDTSGSSSQPEIVTVPERIVTISAQNSLSPASSVGDLVTKSDLVTKTTPPAVTYHSASHRLRDDRGQLDSDSKKSLDESGSIPPALSRPHTEYDDDDDSLKKMETRPNPARFQLFSRQTTGHGLQQGAPVSGSEAPDKQRDEDIHISDYKLTDKQKIAKETFARRQGGPVRRVVQARIVGYDKPGTSTEEKSQPPSLGQSNNQVLTAAAAASAAVAATQPFLKAQQEMELKMAEVLAKIGELQGTGSQKTEGFGSRPEHDSERVRQLEKQLGDMTEKRIEYMERLQEQQIAMQAKLLSMTRDAPAHSQPYQPRSYSPDTHLTSSKASNRAFSKTTVAKQPTKGNYSNMKHSALDLDHDESTSPLDTPAPRARAPKPTVYDTSDIEYRVARSRSPKGKSPKARSRSPKCKSPKARSRSRSPMKDKTDRGILHQILDLAAVDSPTRDILRQPVTASSRIRETAESPNVRKAKHLIDDLNHIKHQVQDLVEDKENWKATRKETDIQADIQEINQTHTSQPEAFPLDSYLSIPDHADMSPYKSLPDLSSSKLNAPVLPGFKDAEGILRQVQQNRGYLESNFEAVLRARQEVEVYSMLGAVYNDSTDHEKARIKQMVDKSIQKLRREVEREVTDDMVISAVQKKGSAIVPGAVKMPEPAPTKTTGRPGVRGRLSQPRMEPKVEVKKPVGKRPGGPVKEPVQHKFYRPPPKRKTVFEDEEAMTRIYGKASYQKGRTTVKDPYLHFQNTAKHKPSRQTVQFDTKGAGKEMMSSKTQTSTGGVRQFYFNPSTGTYIPIASAANTAPIPGKLIPMAVPLGGPRLNPGVMIPANPTPGVAVGSKVPLVSAVGNVSMVSIGVEQEDSKLKPELGKQVLPAVDIDTDLSDLSEIIEGPPVAKQTARTPEAKRKKHVQIISPRDTPNKTGRKSPNKPHYEVMFHEDSEGGDNSDTENVVQEEGSITISQPAITRSDNHSDDTLVEDEDVETGTGVELPGYQPEEVEEAPYTGPVFPPKLPSADRQWTSDLIAEDIKRRDLLQNKANEWIEQELMARIITEVYPLKDVEEPQDISHVVSEGSEDSMAEEKEKSMFVMDTIGHHGMQLFVDVGRPVDNTLVNKLVEEVMLEKIRSMLGQRPDSEDPRQPIKSEEPQWEEPVSEELEPPPVQQSMVQTPEPTPRASPRSSPARRISPAYTPISSPPMTSPSVVQEVIEPLTPPPVIQQPVILPAEPESEPESSASYDIKEELDRLADKLRPNVNASASLHSRHDVATPPESPKPEPEPVMPARPLTPPQLSPRQVVEEQFMFSQSAAQAGTSMNQSPTRSRISKSESLKSQKSATSPQVTDLAEEELAEDQPKPVVFTVAETQTSISPEPRPKSRSPSPDKTRSRSPSESSYTESSSISESFNECVSEGQWLINKSDGEVADFPIDEVAVRDRMLRMNRKRVDVSSASTWKDTEDVDLDEMTDVSRSEGEFLYKTEFPPEKDPVLDMLARLQSAAPNYGLYQMSNRQVSDVLNTTGKSEGEVMRVSSVGLPQQQQQRYQQQQQPQRYQQQQQYHQQQYIPERDSNYASPKRSKSPTSRSHGVASGKRGVSPKKESQHRSHSPTYRAPSPTRVSFEGDLNDQQRPASPTRSILKRSSSFENQNQNQLMRRPEFEAPVRDSGRSQTPTGRLTPGGRQPKGMIVAGGRSSSPVKSSMRRPPQVIKSSTMPETRGSGGRLVNVRTSSEDFRDSLDHSGPAGYYGSDIGARNMTPDQMNIDALIQSGGYLSQSFSQSENGRHTAQSSLKSSGDMRQSRASGRSLGYSYGTEGSISMSELQRLADNGTGGKLQMSLTIPGTEVEESDLSEIDITDGGNTR